MSEDETQNAPLIGTEEGFEMQIPDCCRNAEDNCPHVINREKRERKKTNIGL